MTAVRKESPGRRWFQDFSWLGFTRRPAFAMGLAFLVLVAVGVGLRPQEAVHQRGADIGVRLNVLAGSIRVNDANTLQPALERAFDLMDRDHLEASPDFKGQLVWDDGTKVRVDPRSELVVHAHRLELKVGKVWVQVKKRPDQRFSVETPMAVAAVKGTKFDVVHMPGVGSLVKVYQGLVAVTDTDGNGKTVDVEPYRYAKVSMDAPMKLGDFSDDGSVVNDLKPFYRFDD